MRLAYADPPYPGKAHLYPENTEVDHVELIARLEEYDGWALSTEETNLAYVLSLCPPKTRVLAWCRTNSPPFKPYPYFAWEPVLCRPARIDNTQPFRSYVVTGKLGREQRLVGQKPAEFCEWVIGCLGATPNDSLDDLFPGTGVMGDTFARFQNQLKLSLSITTPTKPGRPKQNILRRTAETLPGFLPPAFDSERRAAR